MTMHADELSRTRKLLAQIFSQAVAATVLILVLHAVFAWFSPATADDDGSTKARVPTADELRLALRSLHDVFGSDAATAKSAEAKSRIAGEMLTAASEEPSLVNRFALLDMARRFAEEAGDVDLATTLVNRVSEEFEIDIAKLREHALIEAAGNATGNNASRAVEVLTASAMDAISRDASEEAEHLAKAALVAARKAARKSDLERAQRTLSDLRSAAKAQSRIAGLRDRVKENPTDQKALLELALQLSEIKDDDRESLSILTACSDPLLVRLARADLAADGNPKASLDVADAWWEFSETSKGDVAAFARKRSLDHYHSAVIHLEGLEKTRVEKRISTAAKKKTTPGNAKRVKNLVLHLDAASPVTLLGADNRPLPEQPRAPLPISAWLDPENPSSSAKQANASSRPVSVIHAASGLRAIRFEGHQALISSQALPKDGTLIFVVEPSRPLGPACFFGAVNGVSGVDVWTRSNAEGMFRVLDASGKPFHISTVAGVMARAGSYVVTVQWFEPMMLRINGKLVSDQKNVPAMDRGAPKGIVFGAHSDSLANPYSGLVCECLLFDVQLPADVLLPLERTLSAKWKGSLDQ